MATAGKAVACSLLKWTQGFSVKLVWNFSQISCNYMNMLDAYAVGATCFGHNVRKAARALTRFYDAELRPTGLKITQFSILVVVHAKGEQSLARIAEVSGLEPSTLQRNLSVLRREGWVDVTGGRGPTGQSVGLTRAGRAKLKAAYPIWDAAQKKIAAAVERAPTEIIGSLRDLENAAHALAANQVE